MRVNKDGVNVSIVLVHRDVALIDRYVEFPAWLRASPAASQAVIERLSHKESYGPIQISAKLLCRQI